MTCKVGQLLEPDVLEATERDLLEQALALPRVPAHVLAGALTTEGHPVGTTTIKDHRGTRCACYRKASA